MEKLLISEAGKNFIVAKLGKHEIVANFADRESQYVEDIIIPLPLLIKSFILRKKVSVEFSCLVNEKEFSYDLLSLVFEKLRITKKREFWTKSEITKNNIPMIIHYFEKDKFKNFIKTLNK